MSQINNGIRAVLQRPIVYNTFQVLMGANKARRQFSNNFIQAKKGDNILDIGCGTADILGFLPSGVNYFGFDQSVSYIEYARKKFSTTGQFECAELNQLVTSSLPKMDIVLTIGLIHHLEDDEVNALFSTVKSAMSESSRLIAIDPCYDQGQTAISKWLIEQDRGQNVRNQITYKNLAENSFETVESIVVNRNWIPYTHHIMICRK